MKLLITGYGGHGKDTACDILQQNFGLRFTSSSLFRAEHVRQSLLAYGVQYPTTLACYADRRNHRKKWHDILLAYNTPDKTTLARHLFGRHDIYGGMRNREEFLAVKQAKLFDVAIWIDRSEHVGPEGADSMQIKPTDCDLVIDNNNTLDVLAVTMVDVYRLLASKRLQIPRE